MNTIENRPYRLIIVDDHKLLREAIHHIFAATGFATVVAHYADGQELIDSYSPELGEDIILMDIAMPILDGIEATKKLLAKYPEAKIIALTMYSDIHNTWKILEAGASGIVKKNAGIIDLENAIMKVMAGSMFLPEDWSSKSSAMDIF